MGEGWVVEGRQEPAVQERLEKKLKFLEWLGFVGVQLAKARARQMMLKTPPFHSKRSAALGSREFEAEHLNMP